MRRASLKACLLGAVIVLPAAARAADAPAAADAADSADIVVTARRLAAGLETIQPALGASDFVIDRKMLQLQPQGDNRSLNQVLLQAPGVQQDSYGQLHVRNEHGNLQYRIDGVIVPESISGFGQTIDVRIADTISLLTGTLPAQYGYRTAGVVNIQTRGGSYENGGDIGLYGGSFGTIQPSATLHGSDGGFNYFVSGSYKGTNLGIENPTPAETAIHDHSDQYRGFIYLSQILSDTSKISGVFGTATGTFQIPNNPGQIPQYTVAGVPNPDSATLNQNQKENTQYGFISYQYAGDKFNLQVAPFFRYTSTSFSPDPAGQDIAFNGYSDQSKLTGLALGIQADGSYTLNDAHTLRGGVFFQSERTTSNVYTMVLPANDQGQQTSDQPFAIVSTGGRTGQLYGVYLQDEWSFADAWTLNYGVRFDALRSYTQAQQLSPRVNIVWKPSAATSIHAGYARNFTPPPQELIGLATVQQFNGTTRQAAVQEAGPVKPERENYFDAGFLQTVAHGFTVGLDVYYKQKTDLLDDGQFGEAVILSPFNYAQGYAYGVELTTSYSKGPLSLYANLAWGREKARDIISSQFFFDPAELAYIAQNYIYTDHSQTWTASGGGSYSFTNGAGTLVPSFDFVYGSGLRAADPVTMIPNGATLPGYVQVNVGIAQKFDGPGAIKGVSLSFNIVNLFDAIYQIRDGSGVGVGAPQYGPRRGFYGSISKSF